MNALRKRRLTPAFVVAVIALFVGLGGTAGAVATQAVPLAKRALVADNAKKLGGQSPAAISARAAKAALALSPAGPRPASSAAGVVTVKTAAASLPANGDGPFTVSCDAGQKAVGGGFSSDGVVFNFDSFPAGESGWNLYLVNASESSEASITLYVTCIR